MSVGKASALCLAASVLSSIALVGATAGRPAPGVQGASAESKAAHASSQLPGTDVPIPEIPGGGLPMLDTAIPKNASRWGGAPASADATRQDSHVLRLTGFVKPNPSLFGLTLGSQSGGADAADIQLVQGGGTKETPMSQPVVDTPLPTVAGNKTLSSLGGNKNIDAPGNKNFTQRPSTDTQGTQIDPPIASTPGVAGALESHGASGVDLQKRSPLVVDPRIEGFHFGQIGTFADGGYWFPARVDLDTVISKLGSDNIASLRVVKGPYSVRYGPGFSFLDIDSLGTPRFKEGFFDAKGSTSMNYRTNGRGWQGQQSVWGGNADWGFRLSYDLQSAQDYRSGDGSRLPTAYNNQFADFAFGYDLDQNTNFEVRYFHNQQSNVLFPGLLTNIVGLNTDAFSARLSMKDGPWYDRLTLDTWVNTTRFNGGSANQATRNQIPQLNDIFSKDLPQPIALAGFKPVRLDIATEGYALSYGAREIATWGDAKGPTFSLGADIRVFTNYYNEYDSFNFSVKKDSSSPVNLGIPLGRQIDPGILIDSAIPVGENLTLKLGTRVDFTTTQFLDFGFNVDRDNYTNLVGSPRDRSYFLFSGFASSDYNLTEEWSIQSGYGYAQRPPTLTELYAGGAFLGLIQNGFNSIFGNPELRKEEIHQLDLGLRAKYTNYRGGVSAYYAFLPNYITYENQGKFSVDDAENLGFFLGVPGAITPINKFRFKNTNLATMYGFNAFGEYDAQPWLAVFGALNYVNGRDRTIHEALPGIAPLDSRVGIRIHDPNKEQRWGMEYFARMVATQTLFASTLLEARTAGFVTHNARAYWQIRENLLVLGGIDNIGDLKYREHLDLRTGTGVFQPGVAFYAGLKLTY